MEESGTSTWKLVLSYDGSGFYGWQVQPGLPTIQGELRAAIARVAGETVLPQGSGRTDAGVHALGQVASFTLSAPIPEENLLRALNRILPPAIRVTGARRVPADFHARHSALAKTYEYRIFRGKICPPWLARYVYADSGRLDWEAMARASESVLGEHDFTSFAAGGADAGETPGSPAGNAAPSDPAATQKERGAPPQGNVRTIHCSEWLLEEDAGGMLERAFSGACGDGADRNGKLLTYRVRGNGFLHHMVRNLVGVFLEIGRGRFPADSVPEILAARRRSAAGPTAPARGLFLCRVEYPARLS